MKMMKKTIRDENMKMMKKMMKNKRDESDENKNKFHLIAVHYHISPVSTKCT
jgi:hypothetical protein